MSEKEYLYLLDQIVEEIFAFWTGTMEGLCKKSGMALSTIYRLRDLTTRRPQLRTIVKLAKAVHIRLVLDFSNKKIIGRKVA